MAGVSNLWGQPRPEVEPTPAPGAAAEAEIEPESDAGPEFDAEPEFESESDAGPEFDAGPEPEPVIHIEPVATRDDLPTMAQLDADGAELDEVDAALAAMDADPSLPGRASAQNAHNPQRA